MDHLHSCSSFWCLFFFLFFFGGSCREIVAHTAASCLHLPLLRLLCVSTLAKRDVYVCVCVLARVLYVFGLCKERHLCVCVCECVSPCKKFEERVTRLVSNFSKASSGVQQNSATWVGGEGFALAKACFRSIVFFLGGGEFRHLATKKKWQCESFVF